MNKKSKILILGGGFGGVKAALELAANPHFEVTLLSDQADFRFYPALYMAATGGNRRASTIPLQEIFEDKAVSTVKDTAVGLDRKEMLVKGGSGKTYSYDFLIVALGAVTNFFGIKGLSEFAYGIKSVDEAGRLQAHIHKLLLDEGKPDVSYIIIGGGPTGVELAGALPGYINHIMKSHGLSDKQLNIRLVESAPRLLPRLGEPYAKAVAKRLQRLGVSLELNQKVQAETADSLMVSGHEVKSHSVVWTAGVATNPFLASNNFKLDDHGKAVVDEYLQVEPDIYVIGDNASTPYSGMAQTALFDASFVAKNLNLKARGKKLRAYRATEPAYVTPVGPRWAAVQWRKLRLYGFIGWLVRRVADAVAYHDLENWAKASGRWRAESQADSSCPICNHR